VLEGAEHVTCLQEMREGGLWLDVRAVLRLDDDPRHEIAVGVGGVTESVSAQVGLAELAVELDEPIARSLQSSADLVARVSFLRHLLALPIAVVRAALSDAGHL